MTRTRMALMIVFLLAVVPVVRAQTEVNGLGWATCGLGDVDCDGVDDFAVSAPTQTWRSEGSRNPWGSVRVISGVSGRLVRWIPGDGLFGTSLDAVGDVDGDGICDLIVGSWHAGARVVSTATGTTLFSSPPQGIEGIKTSNVVALGDIDADSVPDFAIATPFENVNAEFAGRVRVHSGRTGTLIAMANGLESAFLGYVLGALGDVDGDGTRELVVTESCSDTRRKLLHILSPRTCREVRTIVVEIASGEIDVSLCDAGDIDRDGVDDLAVGIFDGAGTGAAVPGRVEVFSGGTGESIRRYDDRYLSLFGYSLASSPDLDGDGLRELIVGHYGNMWHGIEGGWTLLSGGTGAQLFRSTRPCAFQGKSVASVGDVDRDGRVDFVVGEADDYCGSFEPGGISMISGANGAELYYFGQRACW